MGIEKSALKVTIAESFSDDIRKRCEKSQQNVYRFQGVFKAFQESQDLINKATKKIRDDFVAGRIDIDISEPTNVGKFLVDEMMKVSKKFHDLACAAIDSGVRSEGEVRGLELAATGIDNSIKSERAKIAAVAEGIESGRLKVNDDGIISSDEDDDNERRTPRAVGTHPGPPIKAKRKSKTPIIKRVRKAAPKKKKKDAKNT